MYRLIAIICATILLAGLCIGQEGGSPPQIKVVADHEEYDWATGHFSAEGNARVTYGETLLTADSVLGDASTGDVEATGHVTFQNGDRTLNAAHFTYNYETRIGLADDASSLIDKIYFRGKELRSDPVKYTVTGSRFTTCNLERPHYFLSAREMDIVPGKKLTARDVSIHLYGATLLTVPKYSVNLAKSAKTDHFKMPQIGFGPRYGLFAGYGFDLSDGSSTVGRLNARLSTQQLLQGGLDYERIAGQPVFLRAGYREQYYGGRNSFTLLTRLPEVGVRFGSKSVVQSYLKPGASLDLSRGLIDARQPIVDSKGVNFIGEVGAGRFTEDPGSISSDRLDTRMVAWLSPRPLDSRTVFSPAVHARFSHYDTGQDYSSLGLSLGISRRFGEDAYGSLAYITNSIQGLTPFGFDAVEIPHELAGRIGFPLGGFLLELGGRYDLSRGFLYDNDISVAKKLHCLEPRLTWHNRFRQFSIDIEVLGF